MTNARETSPGNRSATGIELVVIERNGRRAARLTMLIAGERGQWIDFDGQQLEALIATLQAHRGALDGD